MANISPPTRLPEKSILHFSLCFTLFAVVCFLFVLYVDHLTLIYNEHLSYFSISQKIKSKGERIVKRRECMKNEILMLEVKN